MKEQIRMLYGANYIADDRTVQIDNETGHGMLKAFEIAEGITLVLNEVDMLYCTKNSHTENEIIEINYCREGRYECSIGQQLCCYMVSGSLSISRPVHLSKSACFPTGHYVGISIFLDHSNLMNSDILKIFDIDIRLIEQLTENTAQCFIVRANQKIAEIFDDLYTSAKLGKQGYLRIKAIELLYLISCLSAEDNDSSLRYMNSEQVSSAKRVQALICTDLKRHYTLRELASYAGISETALKNHFKGVYGTSVYAYLKALRLTKAQELLRMTECSVSDIAKEIGYENPNKFSSEFKRFSGLSPTEYRKKCRNG